VLALLWWSWTGYAWLCNVVDSDTLAVRFVLFAAMAAMFLLALCIPEAFDDLPGGLQGPVLVAVCYFTFRLLHLLMFWIVAQDDPGLRRQLLRFAPAMLGATLLLLVAAGTDGRTQTLLWAAALVVDYGGTLLGGADGWRLRSPGHFAERHGLILIVALGESIVALGVGVALLPVSWAIVVAALLGLAVATAMWWAYFDMSALHAEQAFAAEPEASRARFARDAYSYLHVPLVAGIVLTALGMKKVMEYAGDAEHHTLSDPLQGAAVIALYGGVMLYLLGHIGFKWRTGHRVLTSRVAALVAILLASLLGTTLPALGSLTLLAAVLIVMVAFESVRYADDRHALHS